MFFGLVNGLVEVVFGCQSRRLSRILDVGMYAY
jgi:hypothetical protein